MIQIKFSEIKEFFSRAKHIKTATLVPVYAYLKLECKAGVLTLSKANGHSFIIHEIEGKCEGDFLMLLEEKSLAIMCNKPTGDTLNISRDGNKILLTDGRYKQTFVEEDMTMYFKFPEITNKDEYCLTGEILQAIHSASSFVNDKAVDQFSFVHLLPDGVYASDRATLYAKQFDASLPRLILNPIACNVLSYYTDVVVITEPKHLIFKTGKSVFGFTKEEYKQPDFKMITNSVSMGPGFKVNRADIVDFCDRVVRLAEGSGGRFFIENKEGDKVLLNYNNAERGQSNTLELEAEKSINLEFSDPFEGKASQFSKVFSAVSPNEAHISFANVGQHLCLLFTAEPNQISFIMGMANPPNK